MALSDHIIVTSSVVPVSPPPSQRQRVPCFVGVHSITAERANAYSSITGMEADGWSESDPLYNMVAAMLRQKPEGQRPTRWFIGKRDAAVASVWEVEVVATADGTMTITDGATDIVVASFTASSDTAGDIRDGLIASAADGYTLAIVDGTTLSVTREEAGVPMTLAIGGAAAANLTTAQTVAHVGIYADLEAIKAVMINGRSVNAQVWNYEIEPALGPYGWTEAARWAHTDGDHVVGSQSNDADIPDDGETGDGASLVQALGYTRSDLCYRASNTDYVRAKVLGHTMPAAPGSVNYSWRRLVGSTLAVTTSSEHVATFRAKRASWAELIDVDGQVKYFGGRDGTGQPMYHWSAIDNWRDNVKARLVFLLTNSPGIDFTNEGIDGTLVAGLRVTMDLMVEAGTLLPGYTIAALPVEQVPEGEKIQGDFKTTGYIQIDAILRIFVDEVRVTGFFALPEG
jgi:hypothetical protein